MCPGTRKKILIVDADRVQCQKLCDMVSAWHYVAVPVHNLDGVAVHFHDGDFIAVVLDIDSITVDNRTIGRLAKAHPDVCLFCVSENRFHPELQEAIGSHFFACLSKPVDPDELSYWLNSISENDDPA